VTSDPGPNVGVCEGGGYEMVFGDGQIIGTPEGLGSLRIKQRLIIIVGLSGHGRVLVVLAVIVPNAAV
jgi:hypothetical protein